jgi:hypothetical protein
MPRTGSGPGGCELLACFGLAYALSWTSPSNCGFSDAGLRLFSVRQYLFEMCGASRARDGDLLQRDGVRELERRKV